MVPVIDVSLCTGCGLCEGVCSCGSIKIVDNLAVYEKSPNCKNCNRWCGQCELVCPVGAIACPFDIVVESD